MKTAIRISILMVGLFASCAAVAVPCPDGYPKPGFTAPVHQSVPDGYPKPGRK